MSDKGRFKVNAIRETNAAREAMARGDMTHAEALSHLGELATSGGDTSPGYRQYRSIGDSAIRREAEALGVPVTLRSEPEV